MANYSLVTSNLVTDYDSANLRVNYEGGGSLSSCKQTLKTLKMDKPTGVISPAGTYIMSSFVLFKTKEDGTHTYGVLIGKDFSLPVSALNADWLALE